MTEVTLRPVWAAVLVLGAGLAADAPADVLVATNAVWRYAKGTEEASSPVTLWRERGFDDAAWRTGSGPFYFGESLTGTLLSDMRNTYSCVFLRRRFMVEDEVALTNLTLRAACDDGYVAWINGVEVARYNVGASLVPLHTDVALGSAPEPVQYLPAVLPPPQNYLVSGTNVLVVQAFNRLIGNADFQINVELSATVVDATPPVIAAVDPPAETVVAGLEVVRVTFHEAVKDLTEDDLLMNGAPALEVSGDGRTFEFWFAQPASGVVEMTWDGGHQITDLAGNLFDGNAPAAIWRYTLHDTRPPSVRSITPVPGATVARLTQVEVRFTEAVAGLDAADLLVNSLPATNLTGSGSGPFRFEFPAPAPGQVRFAWASGHGITDQAPAPNSFGGGAWTCAFNPSLVVGDVVINEFMALNPGTRLDEDGDAADWIELANRGTNAVSLIGWSLTDDAEEPGLWEFPAVTLPAGAYLVVFASGKDRKPVDGRPLHTSFQLAMDGEYLGLFRADSPRVIATELRPGYPEQRPGISFALTPGGAWGYSEMPTPASSNRFGSALEGIVAMPVAGVGSGFFDRPIRVSLASATPGAEIRYTLDGTVPTASTGAVYTAPLAVQGTAAQAVFILRAGAFKEGYLPSRTATFSYLFPEVVLRQPSHPQGFPAAWITRNGGTVIPGDYALDPRILDRPEYAVRARRALTILPTLSIVLPVDDVFGQVNGIYANPGGVGVAWERPCSAEFLFPDGRAGVKVDAGLRLQGGTSRTPSKTYKHSLRLLFKGDHGPSKLDYPLFEEGAVRRFDTLVLDAGLNLVWNHRQDANQRLHAQYVRDQFVSDLQLAMGWPAPRGRFFHVYLNGLYWGLYDVHERPDASFAAEHLGGDKSEYDSLKNTTGFEVLEGTVTAWNAMIGLADSRLADPLHYARLQEAMDEPNFIDYMILNCWAGNTDWPHHNWYVARRQIGDTRFRFFSWDAEHVLKSVNENRTSVNNASTPAQLYDQLRLHNAEFRLRFADHVHRHFFNGGPLAVNPQNPDWDPNHPDRNRPAARYLARIAEIDDAIVLESARWGDTVDNPQRPGQPYERDVEWLNELNWVREDYLPARSGIVLNQFRGIGLYPALAAPALSSSGGAVPAGFQLGLSAPAGSIHFTTDGSDPRVPGTGAVAPSARTWTGSALVLTNSIRLRARALNQGVWSARTEADYVVGGPVLPLRITEIMYRPAGGDPYEFLELQNVGPAPLDVGGYAVEGVGYAFPPDSTLAPGQVVVLANGSSPIAFAARYPGVAVFGWFAGSLSNGGETLRLVDAAGGTVMSVSYGDGVLWPAAADGGGASLEARDLTADPDSPAAWQASAAPGGTPGLAVQPAVRPGVRLGEVMAANRSGIVPGAADGTHPDWVEIVNHGAAEVDLEGWSLSDGGDAREFVFPAGLRLAPGGRAVVLCDGMPAAGPMHARFQLADEGESLALFDAFTNRIDVVTFGPQAPDVSIVRTEGGWIPGDPSPGRDDIPLTAAPTERLCLNEWLADAPPGGRDWIEFYNRDSLHPASLEGLYLANHDTVFRISVPTVLAPRGFLRLWADEAPGGDQVDFKLAAAGDQLRLLGPDGGEWERVTVSPGRAGWSEGRFPDGSASVTWLGESGTPGSANRLGAAAGLRLNEIMARNSTAVRGSQGQFADWVELHNPSLAPVDLTGVSVVSTPTDERWSFPPGTTLGPGSFLVLWCDPGQPATSAVNGEWNSGFGLDAEGGEIQLRAGGATVLDALRFGPQVANLAIGLTESGWNLLAHPTPGGPNSEPALLGDPMSLRFNEWMAAPGSGDDWFELFNPSALPVLLDSLWLGNDPSILGRTNTQLGPLAFVGPRGFARFIADAHPENGPHHVRFRLSALGEALTLYATDRGLIDEVYFGPQAPGESEGRLPDGGPAFARFPDTSTPGAANYLPAGVVFNEILAHTDPPWEDAIELFNPGPAALDVSGWFLSDSADRLHKYRLRPGSVLAPGGYLVVYEIQFGGPDALEAFSLDSARGDELWLSEANADGTLTGRRSTARFGASANGVAIGRVPTSAGVDFVPLDHPTFGVESPASVDAFRTGRGAPNSGPRIGPVVLNEVHCQPLALEGGILVDQPADEFVELANPTADPIPLFDPVHPTNTWRLRGGVDFDFPDGVTLPARGYLVIANFDPENAPAADAFRTRYGVPAGVRLVGPWRGRLADEGERLTLLRPDTPQVAPAPDAGMVPYVTADEVHYRTAWPWPTEAVGTGRSLQRRSPGDYGNDPAHWLAAAPTPGRATVASTGADSDGDGLPNDWESAHGLRADDPSDATLDLDRDGLSNLAEFRAGTDPRDPASVLRLLPVEVRGSELQLSFLRVPGQHYSLQAADRLDADAWVTVREMAAEDEAAYVTVMVPLAARPHRFYRMTSTR